MLINKKNNNLTFLITNKSKSNIYIRRVEFSTKFLTKSLFSLVFSIAIISVGIFQISKNADINQLNASNKINSINPQTSHFPIIEQSITKARSTAILQITRADRKISN